MIVKVSNGFNVVDYKHRLRLLREIISGENQQEFAERLGIDMKRWNNYERGYPVPREVAFLLMEKFPGISIEWVWFGMKGNMSKHYMDRIIAAERAQREHAQALKALTKARKRVKETERKRPKDTQPR